MKKYEISERDLKTLMRTMIESREIIKAYVDETRICWPSLPNGEMAISSDSPKYKWYRRGQLAADDLKQELAYLTSEYFDRRGHCANYNGSDRRGSED